MSSTSTDIEIGYSTIRMVLDDQGLKSVPVGVVGWNALRSWYAIRLLREPEKVPGIDGKNRPFLSLATEQLQRWAEARKVPYSPISSAPWESRFWQSARDLLTTAVQLDVPRAMDPSAATEGALESLFEAIVQPKVPEDTRRERIDGIVARALGDQLTRILGSRMRVRAFRGVEEAVSRGARGEAGIVVVEGVNLAASTARRDADATVSRIQRIQAGEGGGEHTTVIVGYNASPGGLNGEAHMVDWIRRKATNLVFDLSTQDAAFREATEAALQRMSPQRPIEFS